MRNMMGRFDPELDLERVEVKKRFNPNDRIVAAVPRVTEDDVLKTLKTAAREKEDAIMQQILNDIKRQIKTNAYAHMKRVGNKWEVRGNIEVDLKVLKDKEELETFLDWANHYMVSLKVTHVQGTQNKFVYVMSVEMD